MLRECLFAVLKAELILEGIGSPWKVVAWSPGLAIFSKGKQTLCVSIKKSVLTGCWLHSA